MMLRFVFLLSTAGHVHGFTTATRSFLPRVVSPPTTTTPRLAAHDDVSSSTTTSTTVQPEDTKQVSRKTTKNFVDKFLQNLDDFDQDLNDFDPEKSNNEITSSSSKPPSSLGEKNDNDKTNSILQDLNGHPLTNEFFEQAMSLEKVTSYTCPDNDVFRGHMSNGCRVELSPGKETAFYKLIAFEQLWHCQEKLKTSPYKLVRDIQSYEVVAHFLQSQACEQMRQQTGVSIPRCYDSQLLPNHDQPMKSKFCFLLEDYTPWDGWYQQWLLHNIDEIHATLSTYAKIHAFFWTGSKFWTNRNNKEAAQELEDAVWKSGSYVQPQAQNNNGQDNQCQKVASEWLKKRTKFETQLQPLEYWDTLGERLESVAEECGRYAHPFADDELAKEYQKYRTFTHGDPKQANIFFRHQASSTYDEDDADLQVGLIDFQWAGFGLAATDMAHFLTSAVHADRLENGGEAKLQKFYWEELQTYLVEYGAYNSPKEAKTGYSYDMFLKQYDTAVLDLCRLVIAYTWSRFTEPAEIHDREACARTMNKTSYNKSVKNAVWLMTRCHEILQSRGV